MGIPEPTLNKVAKSIEFARNIKNLRKGGKSRRMPASTLGVKAATSNGKRKNNPPDRRNDAPTTRAVDQTVAMDGRFWSLERLTTRFGFSIRRDAIQDGS